MKSTPQKSTIAALAAAALLAAPAVASGASDEPTPYAHGPLPSGPVKDYSQNAADGTYAPAETPSVEVVTVPEHAGFAWGDAAIGAGVALALSLIALGATTAIRRRRIASPAT
jgi:hypothetical protein